MKTKKKRPTQWPSGNTNTKIQKRSYQKSSAIKELEKVDNLGHLIDQRKIITDIAGQTLSIGQKKWILGTGPNSISNISATIAGLFIKIEFKHGRDQQSKAQRQYQQTIEQASETNLIARTFEQFYNWYNQTFKYNG
jgi:hypothetical protein